MAGMTHTYGPEKKRKKERKKERKRKKGRGKKF